MVKQHLKRINAPREWPIHKKSNAFITRPLPGAHNMHRGMPLLIIIRDLLKYAKNTREMKKILQKKEVMIDGKKATEKRRIVGLMDIISLPEIKENYLVITNKKGNLTVKKIEDKDAKTKLCKVKTKKMEKGKIKLGMHDGRTILTDKKEIKTGDTLIISIPEQEIKDTIKLDKGNTTYMIEGKYKGEMGKIEAINDGKIDVNINGNKITVTKKAIFIIGKEKPIINI